MIVFRSKELIQNYLFALFLIQFFNFEIELNISVGFRIMVVQQVKTFLLCFKIFFLCVHSSEKREINFSAKDSQWLLSERELFLVKEIDHCSFSRHTKPTM